MKSALLTLIGTGAGKRTEGKSRYEYSKTRYGLPDNSISKESAFTFLPLSEYLKPDDVWIFGTPESMWYTIGDYFEINHNLHCSTITDSLFDAMTEGPKDDLEADLEALSEQLNASLESQRYFFRLHGYLHDRDEHWEFFYQIRDIVRNYDKVYLDITHGFRHIPLILYSSLIYTESICDKPDLAGIYYAGYEMDGVASETSGGEKIKPVLDITAAWEMANWFHAVRDFRKNGNARELVRLLESPAPEISKKIDSLHQSLKTTIVPGLDAKVNTLLKEIEKKSSAGNEPYTDILDIIKRDFQSLLGLPNEWGKQVAIAYWYYEHKMYMQAITLLKEAWVTRYLEAKGKDCYCKEIREQVSMNKQEEGGSFKRWLETHKFWNNYRRITDIRNTFDHAGYFRKDQSSLVKSKLDELKRVFSDPVNII